MTIGNIPPSYPSSSPSGESQFQASAQFSLLMGLASAVPGTSPSTGVSATGFSAPVYTLSTQQQNTYWTMRGFSDLMQLWAIESNPSAYTGTFTQADAIAQITGDLQYVYNSISSSSLAGAAGTLLSDINNAITTPTSITTNGPTLMNNYLEMYQGLPPSGYPPATDLNMTTLVPDDSYFIYTAELCYASTPDGLTAGNGNSFWTNSFGNESMNATNMDQFFCSYFYQASMDSNGFNQTTFTSNYTSWNNIMGPLLGVITSYETANPNTINHITNAFGTSTSGMLADLAALSASGASAWDTLSFQTGKNPTIPAPTGPDSLSSFSWNLSPPTNPPTPPTPTPPMGWTYTDDIYLDLLNSGISSFF